MAKINVTAACGITPPLQLHARAPQTSAMGLRSQRTGTCTHNHRDIPGSIVLDDERRNDRCVLQHRSPCARVGGHLATQVIACTDASNVIDDSGRNQSRGWNAGSNLGGQSVKWSVLPDRVFHDVRTALCTKHALC